MKNNDTEKTWTHCGKMRHSNFCPKCGESSPTMSGYSMSANAILADYTSRYHRHKNSEITLQKKIEGINPDEWVSREYALDTIKHNDGMRKMHKRNAEKYQNHMEAMIYFIKLLEGGEV